MLPFGELVNWNDIAIVAQRKEIKDIPARIARFDLPRAQALLAGYRHLWTYDFTHDYMVYRLQREACFPAPFSAHSDVWGTS